MDQEPELLDEAALLADEMALLAAGCSALVRETQRRLRASREALGGAVMRPERRGDE